MNNKLITRIAFMALGACFGASAAYYVVDKKYSEEVEGIKESCETYKAEMKRYKEELDDALATFEDAGVTYDLAKEVAAKNRQRKKEAEESIAGGNISGSYVSYDKIEKYETKSQEPDVKESQTVGCLISQADFCEDNEHAKETCTYYEDHHFVFDATNEEIDIRRFSKEILDALGEMGPYGVLYMTVNDVDYEVTYSDEYWKP